MRPSEYLIQEHKKCLYKINSGTATQLTKDNVIKIETKFRLLFGHNITNDPDYEKEAHKIDKI